MIDFLCADSLYCLYLVKPMSWEFTSGSLPLVCRPTHLGHLSLSSLGILIGIWFGSRITKLKLAIRCGMLISEATIYLACHNASPTLEEFVRDNFCVMLSFSPWWLIVIVSNRGNYTISFCVLYLNIGSPAFLFHHNAAYLLWRLWEWILKNKKEIIEFQLQKLLSEKLFYKKFLIFLSKMIETMRNIVVITSFYHVFVLSLHL